MPRCKKKCASCKEYKPVSEGYSSGIEFYCSQNCLVAKAVKRNKVTRKPEHTKAESDHLALVASLGCIACKMIGYQDTPAEVHHIRYGVGTGQRASHFHTIPLCPEHHRNGPLAFHRNQTAFEKEFATESELLEWTNKMIEVVKQCKAS